MAQDLTLELIISDHSPSWETSRWNTHPHCFLASQLATNINIISIFWVVYLHWHGFGLDAEYVIYSNLLHQARERWTLISHGHMQQYSNQSIIDYCVWSSLEYAWQWRTCAIIYSFALSRLAWYWRPTRVDELYTKSDVALDKTKLVMHQYHLDDVKAEKAGSWSSVRSYTRRQCTRKERCQQGSNNTASKMHLQHIASRVPSSPLVAVAKCDVSESQATSAHWTARRYPESAPLTSVVQN